MCAACDSCTCSHACAVVLADDSVLSERSCLLQVGKVSVADEKKEASGTNGAQNEDTKDAKD